MSVDTLGPEMPAGPSVQATNGDWRHPEAARRGCYRGLVSVSVRRVRAACEDGYAAPIMRCRAVAALALGTLTVLFPRRCRACGRKHHEYARKLRGLGNAIHEPAVIVYCARERLGYRDLRKIARTRHTSATMQEAARLALAKVLVRRRASFTPGARVEHDREAA